MPASKELYFKQSVLNMRKKYSVMRRLAAPVDDGVNIIQNGDFANADGWNAQAGVTVLTAQNRAIWTAGNNNALSQACGIIKSSWYRVEFDILEYQQGFLELFAGSEGRGVNIDAAQTHFSVDLYSNGDGMLYIYGRDNFRGSISNISLKKLVFYEDNWIDITGFTTEKTLNGISRSIEHKSFEFGEVKQDNASLKLLNVYGEMSDEDNEESIFYNGYQRHQSKIKIEVIFSDKDGNESSDILFNGLLDDRSSGTSTEGKQPIIENITAFSYTKLLSDITLSELGTIAGTTINEVVYNIMTRGFFTDQFSVQFANIKAGYNAAVDISKYEQGDKVIDILKDLAKGHSIFGVDNNGEFFFRTIEASQETVMELSTFPERKIQVYDYRSGSDRVIENLYWEESGEKYEKPIPKYKTNATIDVKGIVDSGYRQGLLNYLGDRLSVKLPIFKVDIPLCPFVNLLDKIKVQHTGAVTDNAFVLDISRLDISRLELPISAVKLSLQDDYVVYEVKHSETVTTLTLSQLQTDDYRNLRFGMISCWEFQNNANDRLRANNGEGFNIVYEQLPKGLETGGNVALFNGVNSYIHMPFSESLSPGGKELSVEVWANIMSGNTNAALVSKLQNGGYGMEVSEGLLSGLVYSGGILGESPATEINENEFCQYILIYNGHDCSLWINGEQVSSVYKSGNISYAYANDLFIGAGAGAANTPGGKYFNGKIAAVRFWNRELSSYDIKQLYNAGRGLSYKKIFSN